MKLNVNSRPPAHVGLHSRWHPVHGHAPAWWCHAPCSPDFGAQSPISSMRTWSRSSSHATTNPSILSNQSARSIFLLCWFCKSSIPSFFLVISFFFESNRYVSCNGEDLKQICTVQPTIPLDGIQIGMRQWNSVLSDERQRVLVVVLDGIQVSVVHR